MRRAFMGPFAGERSRFMISSDVRPINEDVICSNDGTVHNTHQTELDLTQLKEKLGYW